MRSLVMHNHMRRIRTTLATILTALSLYCDLSLAAADAGCKAPDGTQPFEFMVGENRLRGFIDLPDESRPNPAVLIIHGSGGTDVFRSSDVYNGSYDILRRTFRAAGVATVVWDKAGNGCSAGAYPHGNPIRERATETVAALRALKQRNDIDAARMGLWGISQGGWIAPMAAVQTDDVGFLILVSGPARDAVSQLEYQALSELRAGGVPERELRIAASHLRRAFALMRAGGSSEDYAAAVAPLQGYQALRKLGVTEGTPDSYRNWQNTVDFHYRPDTALRELQQPVLALFGDHDVLVDWRESVRIYRESFSSGGNDNFTIKIFKNADHNLMAVGSQSRFVDGYLQTMQTWLAKRVSSNDR
jgi:uncharacterized protein